MFVKIKLVSILSILFVLMPLLSCSVGAENWHRFFNWYGTDPADGAKFYLEPQHEQWQICWNYTPSDFSFYLTFYIYMKSGDFYYFYETIMTEGNLTGQHTFLEMPPRQFMVELDLENVQYLEVWGEEDLDSVPEYQTIVILLLFMVASSLIVMARKNINRVPTDDFFITSI